MFYGHLHTHTEYSALDGMAKIEELILRAKELGQKGIAITDHGSSSGLFEAYWLGKQHEFNVILGEEFYFENKSEELKTGHLILLAKNAKGLENIFSLQKLAYDNFYYKPRINLEILEKYNEGLICTTACIANQVGQYILKGEKMLALGHILELKKIFGEDLYVELQSSTSEDVIKVNKVLEELCKDYDLKPIITNDIHYVNEEDYNVHEVLLCIQQKTKMDNPKRWKFENNDYWLKSEEELVHYLDYLDEETIKNSFSNIQSIFECVEDVEIKKGNYLPSFLKDGEKLSLDNGATYVYNEDDALREHTFACYNSRIKERGECNPSFWSDVEKELKVIKETGYSGYYMIVNEYINWAKENGILVGDGRGSGAGSKVAYTIGITEVNPQKYDLLFERFLTPGREPDFDVDFSDIDAVFRHLQDRYGKDNVARVGAFSRFTAKSALRAVMRAYSFPEAIISIIVSYLPNRLSFTLKEAMDESKDLAGWMKEHHNVYLAVERFENIVQHLSTHAGGVIICEGLTKILPIFTDSDNREKMIVALDKKTLEKLGHYKFDILGLKSLTLLQDIIDYTGPIDWNKVDFEDENIYNMLSEGNVLGIFQLSEQPDKVSQQSPKCFEDLIAINALIRPGVCDWDTYLTKRRSEVDENDPVASLPFMVGTHGLIVYQDQYLQLAQHYAGWDIAFSDKHIRKNKGILNDVELKEKWMKDTGGMEDLWSTICEIVSGGYGFNRAHATSYARLAYQTAYMKYYYPEAFYAAYLTQNFDDPAEIVNILNKLKDIGVKVINPDINKSTDKFIPTDDGILFPLNAIKSVGGSVLYEINRLKPISSLDDFLKRRIPKFVKSTAVENLIKSGAFDFEGKSRYELLCEYKEGFAKADNYVYEKESCGYYISSSPFEKYSYRSFGSFADGGEAMTVAEIIELKTRHDKRGREMAFVTGTNDKDTIDMLIFANVWEKNKVEEGQIVFVKGKKDGSKLLVNKIEVLDDESERRNSA